MNAAAISSTSSALSEHDPLARPVRVVSGPAVAEPSHSLTQAYWQDSDGPGVHIRIIIGNLVLTAPVGLTTPGPVGSDSVTKTPSFESASGPHPNGSV